LNSILSMILVFLLWIWLFRWIFALKSLLP
jgi:hypothetical protein